jgi:hypothetical protein
MGQVNGIWVVVAFVGGYLIGGGFMLYGWVS